MFTFSSDVWVPIHISRTLAKIKFKTKLGVLCSKGNPLWNFVVDGEQSKSIGNRIQRASL